MIINKYMAGKRVFPHVIDYYSGPCHETEFLPRAEPVLEPEGMPRWRLVGISKSDFALGWMHDEGSGF